MRRDRRRMDRRLPAPRRPSAARDRTAAIAPNKSPSGRRATEPPARRRRPRGRPNAESGCAASAPRAPTGKSVPTAWRFRCRCCGSAAGPSILMLPAITAEPRPFSTGRLSPVITASSAWDSPSMMTPSTAMRSPGRTRTSMPATTSRTGRSISVPFSTTTTFSRSAANSGSRSRAARARPAASR